MILEKLEYCPLCEADYATQYEYDFQICNNCDPIPTIEEIEAGSFSTAQVAAMAKRIAELEAQLFTLKAQREWVSVKEGWPDDDSDAPYVWLTDEAPHILIGEVWRMKAYHEHWPVSHWQPLPPAPEGE